jgi:hypothetical protein
MPPGQIHGKASLSMFEAQNQHLSMPTKLGIFWCSLMHNALMWPIRGNYRCRTCGRNYLVPWESRRAA